VQKLNLRRWILPRWGEVPPAQIKPLALEQWFESLVAKSALKGAATDDKGPLEWPTIGKLKSIMSVVFKHAHRHELIPASIDSDGRPTNPALLARVKCDSEYEAVVVSPEQMIVILAQLGSEDTLLEWTAALLVAVTGLRAEEGFGLQWHDVDWDKSLIHVRRCWSKGRITAGKTKLSMTQVAMHPALAEALHRWRRETAYGRDEDWIFPSKKKKGKIPRSPGVAAQDYLRPGAVKAGVISEDFRGRFGWHNLRHSLATFFGSREDVSLATIQAMMRHTKPTTTALYLHRVNAAHLEAQGKFLAEIAPALERVG
jgi:integrase